MNRRGNEGLISRSRHDLADGTESLPDSFITSGGGKAISRRDREAFEKARELINLTRFFRCTIQFYAERKMIIFCFIHFVSSVVIWIHFSFIKFEQQADKISEGVHRYWLKRLVPPIEFGSMHAILFQMALIPLTMCRGSISALGESAINRVIPLNRALMMHIHIGYTIVIVVFCATILFFFSFGLLCAEGEQAFCDKFTLEIMITGYCILGTLLIIGGTSYFRHHIPYEIFYAFHHIVFLMYFITIAHTLDIEQRSGQRQRSQTFKWFSSTLLYYFCDRVAMYMNHRYDTNLISSSVVWGSKGSKLIILKAQRPSLFQFQPGQYAYIRMNEISNEWHPFSIASRPDSPHLEFYIQVFEGKSWTKQLWDYFDECKSEEVDFQSLKIEVMGPCGTSLCQSKDISHILAIGGGTGVVPILGLYKEHVHNLLRLEPNKFFNDLNDSEQQIHRIEHGSLMHQLSELLCRRSKTARTAIHQSITNHGDHPSKYQIREDMRSCNARTAMIPIYGTAFLSVLAVAGFTLFSLAISCNSTPIELYIPAGTVLKYFTAFFQGCFAFVSLCFWDVENIFNIVDVVIVIISPFADWYWINFSTDFLKLSPSGMALFSILLLYMIGRLWVKAVSPSRCGYPRVKQNTPAMYIDKLKFVWMTRSASQASEVLPDILMHWNLLVEKWGLERARKVCNISIFVTDPDAVSCALLRREYESTEFYRCGGITFQRPSIMRIIEDHTIELTKSTNSSHSLLAFCGSPSLEKEVHFSKISNDMITAMTGYHQSHTMDFVSESYGGTTATSKNESSVNNESVSLKIDADQQDCVEVQLLTNRKTFSFLDEGCSDNSSVSDVEKHHKNYLFEI